MLYQGSEDRKVSDLVQSQAELLHESETFSHQSLSTEGVSGDDPPYQITTVLLCHMTFFAVKTFY